jgi:NADH-quinone oxidoreductase subunit J
MISPQSILALGTALAAVGVWWLLPGSGRGTRATGRRRTVGGVLALMGFGCLGSQVPIVGDWFTMSMFHAIAAATIVAAVATISFRSPVYCAIWFGMTLTGTAGLFLMAGAEFLAVATLIVYAGAILVTFLFVLMLSQPEGHTSYDRRSWEPMLAAFIGAALVGVLTMMIGRAIATQAERPPSPAGRGAGGEGSLPSVVAKSGDPGSTSPQPNPLHDGEGDHTAPPTISRLGAVLFTQYLVAVEAAGALLFAALVGASVIVTQGRAAMKRPATEGGTARAP